MQSWISKISKCSETIGREELDMKLNRLSFGGFTASLMLGFITAIARASDVSVTVGTVPTGLSVTVDGTNYSAPAVFTWASNSAHTLIAPSPQSSVDNHTRYL